MLCVMCSFFLNVRGPAESYTLSLHDALPIWDVPVEGADPRRALRQPQPLFVGGQRFFELLALGEVDVGEHHVGDRSEEHTSELQSRQYLVCRLLLEKKNERQRSTLSPGQSQS